MTYGKGHVNAAGNPEAKFTFIGEAPGRMELEKGYPFAGWSGQFLQRAINCGQEPGAWQEIAFGTNVRKCLPWPDEKDEQKAAGIAHYRDSLEEDLSRLTQTRSLLLVGGDALRAVLGMSEISKYHGSFFTRDEAEAMRNVARSEGIPIVRKLPDTIRTVGCTFHPAFTTRGLPQFRPLVAAAIGRAFRWAHRDAGPRRLPQSAFVLEPHPDIVADVLRGNDVLSIDVETDRETGTIDICGIAATDQKAYVFPWNSEYISLVREYVQSNRVKVGHNFLFDMRAFAKYGIYPRDPIVDTQAAAALLWPPFSEAKELGRRKKPGAKWLSLYMCVQRVIDGTFYWKEPGNPFTLACFRASYPLVPDWLLPYLYCGMDNTNQVALWWALKPMLEKEGLF